MAEQPRIVHYGLEEAGFGFDLAAKVTTLPALTRFILRIAQAAVVAVFVMPGETRFPLIRVEHVVEHQSQVLVFPRHTRNAVRIGGTVEVGSELAATEGGAMEAFACRGAAFEFVTVFRNGVAGAARQIGQADFG